MNTFVILEISQQILPKINNSYYKHGFRGNSKYLKKVIFKSISFSM